MRELTHLSLFSGIGGLDLAAEWAEIKTVGQCEMADYPTKVLEKHWPGVPRWRDIRTLTGEDFYAKTGRRTVDVISGGFPCQPFSVAGKQRDKEDDRYLWPEMVRVIKELRPAWVVGENVAGIVKLALPDILSDLEACGYGTRTFLIPACAVGARHRRYRVAIVAYAGHDVPQGREYKTEGSKRSARNEPEPCSSRRGTEVMENTVSGRRIEQGNVYEQPGRTELERTGEAMAYTKGKRERGLSVQPGESQEESSDIERSREDVQHPDSAGRKEQHLTSEPDRERFDSGGCDAGDVCNTTGQRLSDWTGEQVEGQGTSEQESKRPDSNRKQRQSESLLGRMADGLPGWVDGYWDIEPDIPRVANGVSDREEKLKALGNAAVPLQFYIFYRAIVEIEKIMGGKENARKENLML